MLQSNSPLTGFEEMNLNSEVFSALHEVGYHTPTPIQALAIPPLLDGRDILGQARTGTGKTAAFALPLLSRIDLDNKRPQILVLTPTRELAIQVAESFTTYGSKMKGLSVLAVYGGQSYGVQLNKLKKGVHVVVGTPGRLMDHMRRKTITLADLFCTILDEADEMLHMGFIEDVKWILDQTPSDIQTGLFSATMPQPIKIIARKYLNQPQEIILKSEDKSLSTIKQQYWMVNGVKKYDALASILSGISHDGVIVFAKTKSSTLSIAKTLEEKGFKTEALNGDLAQNARERIISQLKDGRIDILVATDVAARGLDVDRISHVINFDMPPKVEPYIHRIGRTGRAGRNGEAILFVTRNERWMLRVIEKATKQKITEISLPSNKAVNQKRIQTFNAAITDALGSKECDVFESIIESYVKQEGVAIEKVAAALAKIAHGDTPFFLPAQKNMTKTKAAKKKTALPEKKAVKKPDIKQILPPVEKGMERYRIEVGKKHGVKPRNIVGAISNEAGLDSKHIGNIDIDHEFTLIDLPFGMPKPIFNVLQKTWVGSRQMAISKCA